MAEGKEGASPFCHVGHPDYEINVLRSQLQATIYIIREKYDFSSHLQELYKRNDDEMKCYLFLEVGYLNTFTRLF